MNRVEDLYLKEGEGALHIKVRVVPGSSREMLAGIHDDALKIKLTTAPEKGKANKALTRLLARSFGVPAASILLVSGANSRDKMVRISGIDRLQMKQILFTLLPN